MIDKQPHLFVEDDIMARKQMEKEFCLSEKSVIGRFAPTNQRQFVYYPEEDVKEFIKRNIGCGIDIGGITCGDSIGEEDDYRVYYCERCNKLKREVGDKLK